MRMVTRKVKSNGDGEDHDFVIREVRNARDLKTSLRYAKVPLVVEPPPWQPLVNLLLRTTHKHHKPIWKIREPSILRKFRVISIKHCMFGIELQYLLLSVHPRLTGRTIPLSRCESDSP